MLLAWPDGVVAASTHPGLPAGWYGRVTAGHDGGPCPAGASWWQMRLRYLIVDDNQSFLEVARHLLERAGLSVAGVASTAAEARRQCQKLHPDVALVDIDLGAENGFDLADQLTTENTGCRVILISAHSGADFADLIEESSALSFIPKAQLSASAIHGILGGADG